MIFKVYYQENTFASPQRENTKSLYLEAEDEIDARNILEEHTSYNLELIQALEGNHLEYEKEHADFSLREFE